MAEPGFDRARFAARLGTRRLGRTLIARATVESTNDVAWEALAAGAPEGTAVVADAQTRGRGRAGRSWHLAEGKGLALSAILGLGCELPDGDGRESGRATGVLPLAAGLALARGLERLGVHAELKWPNDLLLSGRKLSGILCEARRAAEAGGPAADSVVIGAGVNVAEARSDFPPEIRDASTSLALEGFALDRERVAAEFLNALEPLWETLEDGGREPVIEAWRRRAEFWGRPVTVRTPAGVLSGTARGLEPDGALVLALEVGREIAVHAGDVELGVWGR